MSEIKVSKILLPSFYDFWKACYEFYTFYINKGGRGSSKSTSISLRFIFDLLRLPINMIGIRKVANIHKQ